MKRVELYVNSTKQKAIMLSNQIQEQLERKGYEIVRDRADIIIGFGGDGTLLNLLRERNYSLGAKYIGINCGTLGFMQDFEITDVQQFVQDIPSYIQQKINLISLEVINGKEKKVFNALNDFNIQNKNNKTFRAKVEIGREFLEDYIGTGIIFSTPTGSTAHNLSAGGSVIFPEIEVIQITPREAIANREMHCLPKSICIPRNLTVSLSPNNGEEIEILSDADTVYTGKYERINIFKSNLSLIKLTDRNSSFVKKIREKLI